MKLVSYIKKYSSEHTRTDVKSHQLTAAQLKTIALVLMILDHFGAALLEPRLTTGTEILRIADIILRMVGRFSFPLYLLLLLDSVMHTRSGIKYVLKLIITGLLSEIPFDYAFYGRINLEHQNVMFTLALGAAMLLLAEKIVKKERKAWTDYFVSYAVIPIVTAVIAYFTKVDYGLFGIGALYAMWVTNRICHNKEIAYLAGTMCLCFMAPIEAIALIGAPMIGLYNGERGKQGNVYVWYLAYPVHLLILAIARILL